MRYVGMSGGAVDGVLEGDTVLAAHVAGVEDEPEEEDDDGDEVETGRWTSWHRGVAGRLCRGDRMQPMSIKEKRCWRITFCTTWP